MAFKVEPLSPCSTGLVTQKADKSISVVLKLIKTGAVVSCREIHAFTEFRCAGFEHHP